MLTLRAPAKINLTLEVLERRSDGYHDIASVVQTIDLCDDLIFRLSDQVELACENFSLPAEENLVLRAAELLRQASGSRQGAAIRLVKQIPSGAGLGGGSSDAAATLRALNQLWGLRWTTSQLSVLAGQLGSDVPFFLDGATALVQGRGDRVTPLPPISPRWVVLLVPPTELPHKTSTLYRALGPRDYTDGAATLELVEQLQRGLDLAQPRLLNAFDRAARELFPGLEEQSQRLRAAGATGAHLSGSGPALFSLERAAQDAARVARCVSPGDGRVFVAQTLVGPPRPEQVPRGARGPGESSS